MKKGTGGLRGTQESCAVAKEKSFDIAYLWLSAGIKTSMTVWMGSARSAEGAHLGACRLVRWSRLCELVRGAPAR